MSLTPNPSDQPSAIRLRAELEELWAELEQWVAASDEWTDAKRYAAAAMGKTLEKLDKIENWRHIFSAEIGTVRHTIDTLPARSTVELQKAIEDAKHLMQIPHHEGF